MHIHLFLFMTGRKVVQPGAGSVHPPPTMKSILLAISFALVSQAAEPVTIKLWPQGAPEKPGIKIGPEDELKKGDGIKRVTNVTDPTITIYKPENANGTSVLVCPGGGYGILAIEHEGTKVCEYLNTLGVTGILLKYRVPKRDPADPSREPLQDAQRAMGILRHRAAEFGLKPDRIGILGFSAGGHLTVMTTLHANDRTYPQDPAMDVPDATPNFSIPVYPAYLVSKDDTFTLLPEIKVTDKAPPMCLIHAHDDKGVTSASSSALLYLEYKKLNLPAELHIYAKGGHGFGMKQSGLPTAAWHIRAGEWMKSMGWLN
jgi:acetyl esterase/lipase